MTDSITLQVLKDRLAQAERELLCADMIDNYARRDFQIKRARERIAAIELEIKRLSETVQFSDTGESAQ